MSYNLRSTPSTGTGFSTPSTGTGFSNLSTGTGFVFLLLFFLPFLEGDGWGGYLIIFVAKKV